MACLHKLLHFGFAHGVRIGQDTVQTQLVALAKKIVEKEAEGVAPANAAAMMHAPRTECIKMFGRVSAPPELREMAAVGIGLSRTVDDARMEFVALGGVPSDIGQRKSVAQFHTKASHAVRDGKGKPPARRSRQ